MGFWHTGYAEFHELTGLGDWVYTPPPPVRYVCEHCEASFEELDTLRKHRFEQHPVRQPVLLLRGKPIGALSEVLNMPLYETDVEVVDASRCVLNGKPVKPEVLGQCLSALRREFVELELQNQGASTHCKLDFQVADEADLVGVEDAFVRLARERILSIDAIARFNDDCRAFGSAMTYCDGISHYLYGVMAKERSPESGLKREDYPQRYLRSSKELEGFERPLARSIRALVAFHFNHFDDAVQWAPEGALRQAAAAFAGLLQGIPWHFEALTSPKVGDAIAGLLTDQDTLQILDDASHGIVELKVRADELLAHLRRATTGGYDYMKRALLACEALAACDDTQSHLEARRLARELAGKNDTSSWATAMLERLPTP